VADPFCPSCGTEVDEDARFCPTCGRTLMLDEDAQPEAAPLPGEAAPLAGEPAATMPWAAEPAAGGEEPQPEPEQETAAIPDAPDWPQPLEEAEPTRTAEEPPPPAPGPATSAGTGPQGPTVDLPVTWPVTLSGWLIGAGSLAAALTLLVRLGNPLNLLIFLALLAIAASVFLADRLPTIPNQRLAILVVLMVSLGVALERAAFRIQGVESVFLIAMILAAGGALLLELGRDRPVPPLGGPG
jgi:hypothetical protein